MTNPTLDAMRRDREALVAELLACGSGTTFRGNSCRCPFHDDAHASAGIHQGDDGGWRFKCQVPTCGVGGDVFDLRARRTGKELAQVLQEAIAGANPAPRPPVAGNGTQAFEQPLPVHTLAQLVERYGKVGEKVFVYADPVTRKRGMVVIRIDEATGGKRFLQGRPGDDGLGFVLKAPAKPWPLYNRARVREAGRVLVVEGEGCVHALHRVGIVATTSPGGAGKAKYADWQPLAGKAVVLWPDFDPPGVAHMRDVAGILATLQPPCSVSSIDPATLGLCAKGDAADFVEIVADLPVEAQAVAVEDAIAQAVPLGPGREIRDLMEDTIAGRRRALPWPWSGLSDSVRALLPGTMTLICGEGGASKSFLLIQAAAWWHAQGHRVAVYELEGTRAEHMQRALAQAQGDSRVLDDEWVRENAAEARAVLAAHGDKLASFGACLWEAPAMPPDLATLAAWVKERALAGVEIICIDPLTAALPADKAWIADAQFVLAVKSTLRETGARLVLVMHPKKGHKGPNLDDLAGGAVYSRLCETVLWLQPFEPPQHVQVKTRLGAHGFDINRVVRVLKARHGRGTGERWAYTFDGGSLTYREHGTVIVERKVKGGRGQVDEDAAVG